MACNKTAYQTECSKDGFLQLSFNYTQTQTALTCSDKVSDTGPLSHLFGCSYSFLSQSKILTNRDLSYINDRVPGVLSVSSPAHNEGSSLFGELCKVYASISICPPRWVSTLSSQENRTIFFLLHRAFHFMTEHFKKYKF